MVKYHLKKDSLLIWMPLMKTHFPRKIKLNQNMRGEILYKRCRRNIISEEKKIKILKAITKDITKQIRRLQIYLRNSN